MHTLKDIIQQCHKRHGETLRQRKTVVTPILQYREIAYHFEVHLARGTAMALDALEQANISFMPIGHAPDNDRAPRDLETERFLKRQGMEDWRFRGWFTSWGIQIYTGIPSERDGANWHDLYFTYQAISAAPEAVSACIEALLNTTGKPLLTLTKSGGLRFSCRVPNYLHPKTAAAQLYTYKHTPTAENPHHRDVYLEILGENGYSRWDTRYEILLGDLLDPPVIAKEVLFAPIAAFRDALHDPDPSGEKHLKTVVTVGSPAPATLGSKNLNLAKAAFLKRGFSYLREDTGFHHWIRHDAEAGEVHASLWEDQGIVWVRTSTPNAEIPARAIPLTNIWDDTGITPPRVATGLPVTDKVLSVREGELSPLAIKRPSPTLSRQEPPEKVYGTLEENTAEIGRFFQREGRVIGVISAAARQNVEAYLLENGATCLNVPNDNLAEAIEQRYEALNFPSFGRWRSRMDGWEQVKDIPIQERMATPFQRGNLCEDPERCRAVDEKGGDSRESICPHCPVYTECQERGYLSQSEALQSVKAQILPTYRLFLDPQHAGLVDALLEGVDGRQRMCIIDKGAVETDRLFLRCRLLKAVLEGWVVNWRGRALGNFAEALRNALAPQGEPNRNPITRVRAVVEAFQQHEAVITQQMCHINVRCKVVANRTIDAETGEELARWTLEFDGGTFAYIPLDSQAEDKLRSKGLPFFQGDAFTGDSDLSAIENIEVPMRMADAIALGILDTETVESIQAFPTVCKDPNWTYWHQLQRFFAHYTRDADAPMHWSDTALIFQIPPVLHPSVKRLLLMSAMPTQRHLRRIFPSDEIEGVRTEPIAWIHGNRVFQIRTGTYALYTLLSYDSDWSVPKLSQIGERFLFGISAEIDADPSIQHAVVTNRSITRQLGDLSEKENVCFVTDFKELNSVDFEAADVLWIVGTPQWQQSTIWREAQMLFGNDDEPLYYEYEGEVESHYKDERIQRVYHQSTAGLLTQIVEQMGLDRWTGKRVVLLTSTPLPNITDRPETLLFDWEDFEVADGLDKLPEVIATRARFEAESAKLTASSSRKEIERILGCSSRQANRVLYKLRGGKFRPISFREQILFLLASGGERKTSEFVTVIDGTPQSIGNELKRLVDTGEIVKVRRGVYALKTEPEGYKL